MTDVLNLLTDPDLVFLRNALMVGILASVSFGVIGTYVVTRRISYLAGAISHSAFGGIGAALYMNKVLGFSFVQPIHGAIVSALVAAVIMGLVSLYAGEREDTVIGAIWAVGMATGLLFIDITPGYFEISSFLFGDILLISSQDIVLVVVLDLVILLITTLFFNKLLAVCFDDEYATLRGVNSGRYYILLLCLTALTIVLLVRIVGIVMVIALLTLPSAIAGKFTSSMGRMMLLSILLCMAFNGAGLGISYSASLSSGPTIIVLAGLTYLSVIAVQRLISLVKNGSH
ncbi:ABC-type Mn2+/Zn2+ transport system, permease component [Desulforapulum autotrophicum HRM2]|uniref:ABC-type Mn2+/Zn2+ transport system, permease component n=1 Tax=Desulforapulum autotrophicum (strain ATCC 43914 / DSM 3382 / VKM B-1955 / HRM2) TaxID=177437 RepID=C0QM19_DESAH|nr:metal ABC transporter permease [Desulforapulum autotrophicum]ACN14325.1 ABC-type Mn2+/Zn2+ transport system, permease component [Desulforapulum autotrophicum HRM2]